MPMLAFHYPILLGSVRGSPLVNYAMAIQQVLEAVSRELASIVSPHILDFCFKLSIDHLNERREDIQDLRFVL